MLEVLAHLDGCGLLTSNDSQWIEALDFITTPATLPAPGAPTPEKSFVSTTVRRSLPASWRLFSPGSVSCD